MGFRGKGKFDAVRTNGYASKREANRAAELEMLERGKKIANLVKQPRFTLVPDDELGRAIYYVADFRYFDRDKQEWVIEDVKGFKTPIYKLKRRLLWSTHRLQITEI
jgi:F0F1-type ATP synthase alpha subunit